MARSSFMWWTSNKTKPLRCSWITSTIYNGKRTQWSPVRSVITLGRNPSWRVWLQTEYDDTKFCDQLIRTISKFVIFSAFLKLKCKIFYSENKIIPGGSRLRRVWLQTEFDDTKFCYQLIRTISKFVIVLAFLKLKHKIFYSENFCQQWKKKPIQCACAMACTVQLLSERENYGSLSTCLPS